MAKSRRSNRRTEDVPVRVLLAADLRLGAHVEDLPELAGSLRPLAVRAAERAFERLVELAIETPPDAVLLTGTTLAADADLAAVRTLRAGVRRLVEAEIPLLVVSEDAAHLAGLPLERLDPADGGWALKRGKRTILRVVAAGNAAAAAEKPGRAIVFGSGGQPVPDAADLFVPTDPGPRHRVRDGEVVVHHPGPACPVRAGETGICAATAVEFRKDGVRLSERPVSPLRREEFAPPLLDDPGDLPEHLRSLAAAVETAPHERLRLTVWNLQPGPWGDRWRKRSGREELQSILDEAAADPTPGDGREGTAVLHRVRLTPHPEALRAEEGSLAFAFAAALDDLAGTPFDDDADSPPSCADGRLADLLAGVPEGEVARGAVRWGLPLLAAE